jgi:hypothetical protein
MKMIDSRDVVLFVFGVNAGTSLWLLSLSLFHATGFQFVASLIMGGLS